MSAEKVPSFTPEHIFWSDAEEGDDMFYGAILDQATATLDAAPGDPADFKQRNNVMRSAVVANTALYESGVDLLLVGQVRTSAVLITSLSAYVADEQGEGMRAVWRGEIDQLLDDDSRTIRDVESLHETETDEGIDAVMPLPERLRPAALTAVIRLYSHILPAFEGREAERSESLSGLTR